jgi:hypothetical protein
MIGHIQREICFGHPRRPFLHDEVCRESRQPFDRRGVCFVDPSTLSELDKVEDTEREGDPIAPINALITRPKPSEKPLCCVLIRRQLVLMLLAWRWILFGSVTLLKMRNFMEHHERQHSQEMVVRFT